MSSQANNINGNGNGQHAGSDASMEEEVSVLDLMLILTRNKTVIIRTIQVCFVIGLLLAIFSSPQYTSWAKVIRESNREDPSRGLAGLSMLRGFGVNLGGAGTGLNPSAYPDIALSREVRLEVVRDTFYFAGLDQYMTYTDYVNLPGDWTDQLIAYTIGLPRTLKRMLRPAPPPMVVRDGDGEVYPSREEEEAMIAVSELVSVWIDDDTGLMTLSVSTSEPRLAADLAQSFSENLVERVRIIRTRKSREDLQFVEDQFVLAGQELTAAENSLAEFEDRNTGLRGARQLTERARLQRQVSAKSDLYNDLQAHLTQARIDLQRSEPVITILERPVPPVNSSGPRRTLLVMMSLIIGFIMGIGLAFGRSFIDHQKRDVDEQPKLEEIQKSLSFMPAINRFRKWVRKKPEPLP